MKKKKYLEIFFQKRNLPGTLISINLLMYLLTLIGINLLVFQEIKEILLVTWYVLKRYTLVLIISVKLRILLIHLWLNARETMSIFGKKETGYAIS